MERRAIAVRGTVQGVGFRPFVYGLATGLNLGGFVTNNSSGVQIEVEGEPKLLDEFLSRLTISPPPLARIDDLKWGPTPIRGENQFRIKGSVIDAGGQVIIASDVGTCDDCLAELFDPRDRRFRYPFLNCTNCGPRLTIVKSAPYDRARTTMAGFPMCEACRKEYEDPSNRRFHAQPTACAACGPRLFATDENATNVTVEDPLQWFIEALRAGQIGAMKGLGGYHLICDARNEKAVAELRRRKHRDEKPFAVMVPDVEAAERLCLLHSGEKKLLTSPARPIVLLKKHSSTELAERVAPGNPMLGIMLPYTPLHHLLLHDIGFPLVMTSGNRSDEPIATDDPEAFQHLHGIADLFLTHDRPIHVRCDDSVTRIIGGFESPIRRSRGYAPQPINLPIPCSSPILAVGGQLKGTFALGNVRKAIVGHHLGDLDHFKAYQAFEKDIALYERLFEIRPRYIAHDLHPDYASTRYAQKRAADNVITLLPIQHHHAHMASCMAEHDINERVIGISFDGTGFGPDGAIWGGEFLVGDFHGYERMAHLRYVPLPGGDAAVKEPWRMAIAYLQDSNVNFDSLTRRIAPASVRLVEQMIEKRLNAPLTSSAGRLFDAVASLIGLRDRVSFEGQAAMQLEWLAAQQEPCGVYPFEIQGSECESSDAPFELDLRPMIQTLVDEVQQGVAQKIIARRFHSTLVDLVIKACLRIRQFKGINKVVCSGGVFMNSLLASEVAKNLQDQDFLPFQHHLVPPNDGGLSLGQLAIAACRIGAHACASGFQEKSSAPTASMTS